MDSLDKLLTELKAEYEQPAKIEQRLIKPPSIPSSLSKPAKSDALIDNLLADVKTDFQQQDLAMELQKQEQLRQEQLRQQQLQNQRREAVKKQAQDWLNQLDQFSPEGLWFERFADKYSSKLEAAIDYLQAMEES